MISILDKVCVENNKQIDIYDLSINVFDKLNGCGVNPSLIFIYFLIQINKFLGFGLPINQPNHLDEDIIAIIGQFNHTIDVLDNIDSDLVNKIDLINQLKIIIYEHMKYYVIDLNDIYAVNMLKNKQRDSLLL